jgi:hypothetical protein
MRQRLLRAALSLLTLAAATSCALPDPRLSHASPASAAHDGDQVLVMLRMAPAHFRGGSDYGGDYDNGAGHQALQRAAVRLAGKRNLDLVSEWPMPALGLDCYLMRIPDARPIAAIIDELSREPDVAWAQQLHFYRSLGHDDPLFSLQLGAQTWHLAAIHAVTTGHNVLIAQVDSGVQIDHPDLLGQVALSENFVDDGPGPAEAHGTAVAGIIAARADNGIGIAGVAPGARLMALRACWEEGAGATRCNSFTLAKALQFALRSRAGIINLSLTGPDDRLLTLLLDAAHASGVVVVGAYDPTGPEGGFPATHPGVIAVAAEGSTTGAQVVLAPGHDIPATLPGSRWGFVNGTSYAAAQVSGLVALLRQLRPDVTPAQARQALLLGTVVPPGAPGLATLDACNVLYQTSGICVCQCRASSADTASFRP